ncbi:putative MFS family arabinose efflux permease [Nitrobacteraceae bacterium AZCC 2146]
MNVAKHVHQQAGRIEGSHGSQVAVLRTDDVTASQTEAVRHPHPLSVHHISPGMTFLLAACCGLIAAGSYFAQPLSTLIGRDLNLPPTVAGLIVTVSQLGYVLGLLLLAPLGDLVENRRLLLCMLGGSLLSLIVAAMAPIGAAFLSACFGIGVSSIAVQLLVTLASFMSDPKRRGHVVGNVTSGMLMGVLLAWPLASFVSSRFGWRMLFGADAAIIAAVGAALSRLLPQRFPTHRISYANLVGSLWSSFRRLPELRGRAATQALLFGSFSLFWTAVPMELRGHYGLKPDGIALFGLVGGIGALVAPVAGRLADRGIGRVTSLVGVVAVVLAFILAVSFDRVWVLGLAAIKLNAGVQINHVISQRAILSIEPHSASRLNSVYIAVFFLGGAAGSAMSVPVFLAGWLPFGLTGAALGMGALWLWAASTHG